MMSRSIPEINPPDAQESLIYDGSAQEFIIAGSTSGDTIFTAFQRRSIRRNNSNRHR